MPILRCSCTHHSQDALHGSGMRVHNSCGDPAKKQFRCTVCNNERSSSEASKPPEAIDKNKKKKK